MTGGFLWFVAAYLPKKPLWVMQRCHLKDAEHVSVQVGAVSKVYSDQSLSVLCHSVQQPMVVIADGEQRVQDGKSH